MNRYEIVIAWINSKNTIQGDILAKSYPGAIEEIKAVTSNLSGNWYFKKIEMIEILL